MSKILTQESGVGKEAKDNFMMMVDKHVQSFSRQI
jgi:hypothetical protein